MTESAMSTRIRSLYAAFNARDSAFVIEQMAPDVRWPRAFEGDFVVGQEAVRAYWEHQWSEIDPHVEPVSITEGEHGRFDVEVHQVVRDLTGNLLADDTVRHVYTFADGLIAAMEVPTPRVDLGTDH